MTLPHEQVQAFTTSKLGLFKKAVCDALIAAEHKIFNGTGVVNPVPADIHDIVSEVDSSKTGVHITFQITPHGEADYRHIKSETTEVVFEDVLAHQLEKYGFMKPRVFKRGEITKRAVNGTALACDQGEHAAMHRSVCMACEQGSYCIFEFRFLCPAGKYQSKARATGCAACQKGEYQNTPGMTVCWDCPAGRVSSHTKRRCCEKGDASKCIAPLRPPTPAPTPLYTAVPTPVPTKKGECKGCRTGKYKSASGSCPQCPPGKYKSVCGDLQCEECPAGKFQPGTDPALPCSGCVAGHYALGGGAAACKKCDKAFTAAGKAAIFSNYARTKCISAEAMQDVAAQLGVQAADKAQGEGRNMHEQAAAAGAAAAQWAVQEAVKDGNDDTVGVTSASAVAAAAAVAAGGSLHDKALAAGMAAGLALAAAGRGGVEVAHAAAVQAKANGGALFTALQAAAGAAGRQIGDELVKSNAGAVLTDQKTEGALASQFSAQVTTAALAEAEKLGLPHDERPAAVSRVVGAATGVFMERFDGATSSAAAAAAAAAAKTAAQTSLAAGYNGGDKQVVTAEELAMIEGASAAAAGQAATSMYLKKLREAHGKDNWVMTESQVELAVDAARNAAKAAGGSKVNVAAAAGAAAGTVVLATSGKKGAATDAVRAEIVKKAAAAAQHAVAVEYCGAGAVVANGKSGVESCAACNKQCAMEQALAAGGAAADVAQSEGLDPKRTAALAGSAAAAAGGDDDTIAKVVENANVVSDNCAGGMYATYPNGPNVPLCVSCAKPAPGARGYYCANDLRRMCPAGKYMKTSQDGCTLCEAGKYQTLTGTSACDACGGSMTFSSADRVCCTEADGGMCPTSAPTPAPTTLPPNPTKAQLEAASLSTLKSKVTLPRDTKLTFGAPCNKPACDLFTALTVKQQQRQLHFCQSIARALKLAETSIWPTETPVVKVDASHIIIVAVDWAGATPALDRRLALAAPAAAPAASSSSPLALRRRVLLEGADAPAGGSGVVVEFEVKCQSAAELARITAELRQHAKASMDRMVSALNNNGFGLTGG